MKSQVQESLPTSTCLNINSLIIKKDQCSSCQANWPGSLAAVRTSVWFYELFMSVFKSLALKVLSGGLKCGVVFNEDEVEHLFWSWLIVQKKVVKTRDQLLANKRWIELLLLLLLSYSYCLLTFLESGNRTRRSILHRDTAAPILPASTKNIPQKDMYPNLYYTLYWRGEICIIIIIIINCMAW